MKAVGIIPARFASTRFPGKPLVEIGGKTMIQRVVEQAEKANLAQVVVATDHKEIFEHVLGFGGKALMTSEHHQSGTDRCYEAYLQLQDTFDLVVNIQGDEPFIQPEQINTLLSCFGNPDAQVATLIKRVQTEVELLNTNSPKVVIGAQSQALYFSRHPIPFVRGAETAQWLERHVFYKHIGIYGYRAAVLGEITKLAPSLLEKAESLEQLRWLEHGYTITTAVTETETLGIDSPLDLEKAMAYLQTLPE